MRSFIAATIAAAASATLMNGEDYTFLKYVAQYAKSYGTVEEFNFRKANFLAAHAEIAAFNSATQTIGHNVFSDWSADEFKKLLGYRAQDRIPSQSTFTPPKSNDAVVDWRSAGAVTPVKDQKACGSCWSFSTTGALEGAHFIASGELLSLSEQQLMDCSWKFGNLSCGGGLMDSAFNYAKTTPITTEAQYPYTAMFHTSCGYVAGTGKVQVSSYYDVTLNSAQALKDAIALGPVSVAIQANEPAFQYYTSGIITSGCGTSLDHGVLAVGYGSENGVEYTIVKNSWGPSWGESGFVRIGVAEGAGICGINSSASQPQTN